METENVAIHKICERTYVHNSFGVNKKFNFMLFNA